MKKKINNRRKCLLWLLPIGLVTTCLLVIGCTIDETQRVTNLTEISMRDEFNIDGAPNSSIWGFDIGTGNNGWGNQELQFYTDRPENVKVENGVLSITARQEDFNNASFTSSRLLTRNKFEQAYGRFEARIKLPFGQGIWPAFWMLGARDDAPWPQIGEIDIMEYRGQNPTEVLGSLHGPGYSAGEAISKSFILENDRFDTDFHVFGIEWGPNVINYYVDDVLYNQITPEDVTGEWVFNGPFYILMNVAVGGTFVGSPNSETRFPQTMEVDYVRVYSSNNF